MKRPQLGNLKCNIPLHKGMFINLMEILIYRRGLLEVLLLNEDEKKEIVCIKNIKNIT